MTKSAIIHIRTTKERKDAVIKVAKQLCGYTQTKVIEEGIDLFLKKKAK